MLLKTHKISPRTLWKNKSAKIFFARAFFTLDASKSLPAIFVNVFLQRVLQRKFLLFLIQSLELIDPMRIAADDQFVLFYHHRHGFKPRIIRRVQTKRRAPVAFLVEA